MGTIQGRMVPEWMVGEFAPFNICSSSGFLEGRLDGDLQGKFRLGCHLSYLL